MVIRCKNCGKMTEFCQCENCQPDKEVFKLKDVKSIEESEVYKKGFRVGREQGISDTLAKVEDILDNYLDSINYDLKRKEKGLRVNTKRLVGKRDVIIDLKKEISAVKNSD